MILRTLKSDTKDAMFVGVFARTLLECKIVGCSIWIKFTGALWIKFADALWIKFVDVHTFEMVVIFAKQGST